MLELIAGIHQVQRVTRASFDPDPTERRRRRPGRGSRIAAGRRFVSEAMIALAVPAPTRGPSGVPRRPRTDGHALPSYPPRA